MAEIATLEGLARELDESTPDLRQIIGKVRLIAAGSPGAMFSSPSFPARPGSLVARVDDAFMMDFAAAVNDAAEAAGMSGDALPSLASDPAGVLLKKTTRLQAALEDRGLEGTGGGLSTTLLIGAAAVVGVLALAARRQSDPGIGGPVPQEGRSRGLKVALLGASSGMAGMTAGAMTHSHFLAPLAGGGLGALAHNELTQDLGLGFDADPPRLGLYGAAAGLGGMGLAGLFRQGESLVPILLGAAVGGAVAAVAADALMPESRRLDEAEE